MPCVSPSAIGGTVPVFHENDTDASAFVDPVVSMALRSAQEAVDDSGANLVDCDRNRIGCVIGTSKPGLRSFAAMYQPRRTDSQSAQKRSGLETRRHSANSPSWQGMETGGVTPELWNQFLPNAASLAVARRFRIHGPCLCPVAACATGLICLQRGFELIRDGYCDFVLAGGSDASLVPMVLGSFKRMGVLARESDSPATACRPFDRDRSGFVIGEGAAVLTLERLDDAVARGAEIYGEWLGGGIASNGSDLTGLNSDGEALSWLITDVLRRAGVEPREIDYVNLHGTATRQNDVYETRALKSALGKHAGQVSCSSLKGGIGHLLGAAGCVETAAVLLAMRDAVIPPTVNLTTPDPECDLDYTPRRPNRKPVRTALKLSLGFGGHLAAAVLRAV